MIDITPEDSTSPVYLVPLTEEQETELRELDIRETASRLLLEEQEAKKSAARQSALEKLAALGLTEEEAKAVIGL